VDCLGALIHKRQAQLRHIKVIWFGVKTSEIGAGGTESENDSAKR